MAEKNFLFSILFTCEPLLSLHFTLIPETNASELNEIDFGELCGVLVQYPNSNGDLVELSKLNELCEKSDSMLITATDLLALTLFKPVGEYPSVQIAIGSAQRLGVPLMYGGPHAAFLATRNTLTRLMPGRVVGVTKDTDNNTAFRLALQTREQHIRRDKATSNICTAQALLANISAMFAIFHGPAGLRQIAEKIHQKTAHLADSINATGRHRVLNKIFFDTIKIRTDDQNKIKERANQKKINLRYFDDGEHVGLSLDETVTEGDLNDLKWIFEAEQQTKSKPAEIIPENLKRTSSYLTHEVFNSHQSETRLLRYMKRLENKDISLVHSMIPLGSCTMKVRNYFRCCKVSTDKSFSLTAERHHRNAALHLAGAGQNSSICAAGPEQRLR